MAKGKPVPAGQTSITSFFGGGSSKPKESKKAEKEVRKPAKKTKKAEVVDVDEDEEEEKDVVGDDGDSDYKQEEVGEEEDDVEEADASEEEAAVPSDDDEPVIAASDSEDEKPARGKKTKIVPPDISKLPPIHQIPAIFYDLVGRVPEVKEVVEQLQGRKMRVATMCSGTESPLLALELIRRSIKDHFELDFELEHVFSCEIEPFKQAYIERNFSPPLLFRDVCELGQSHAHTAYGALAPVPGDVDLLVAGTSCVDYSNLNNEKQDIDAQGESGRTFRGMMDWVKHHRPPLVILENVCGAPWKRVQQYFAKEDYSAEFMRVDTKQFYIPHTRTRVYLLAVNKRGSALPKQWLDKLKSIQRPASSTLDAFLLPSDDPRIHQARERLVRESFNAVDRRTGRTDWGRCESRHQRARLEEELGAKRPLTNWEDGGYCKLPDFAWNDWGHGQVERVWDLMDISLLRSAKLGVDPSYKTIVWNLSQNVDRTIGSSKMGICPCLTPSMIPYITNRGGPMVGLEALSMQGLPVDELLLTRESEDQLADLAGNAMSTTVVGACILTALVVGKKLLRAGDDKATYEEKNKLTKARDDDDELQEVVMKTDKLELEESVEDHISGEEHLKEKPLDLSATSTQPLAELLADAQKSARLCECEGRKDMTDRMLNRCQDCGSSSCVKCGGRPEHNLEAIDVLANPRLSPSTFARELKSSLPMALVVSEITKDLLDALKEEAQAEISSDIWKGWRSAVLRACKDELRFVEPKRQEIWVVTYQSNYASLELSLHPQQPEWRLFAKPDDDLSAHAKLRTILESPVARLRCLNNLLDGRWDFALPYSQKFSVTMEGSEPVPSWEAKLGLQGAEFRDKTVHSKLEISVSADDTEKLDRDISGTYVLLDKCGTANSALHKKISTAEDEHLPPVFMMLDPSRCGAPEDDAFVFSISKRRLEYGEDRPIICQIDSKWRQSSVVGEQTISSKIPYQWVQSSATCLKPAPDRQAFFAVPKDNLSVDLSGDACKSANAVLICRVPLHSQVGPEWSVGAWKEVDKVHERLTFKSLAWLTERVRNDDDFTNWQDVSSHDTHEDCTRCAPRAPSIKWARNDKKKIVAVEDAAQAGAYERALKKRPAPFVTQLKVEEDGTGHVRIGINIASLMHRALSRLPSKGRVADATLAWRLNTDFAPMAKLQLPKFTLRSNKSDVPHAQPPHFLPKMGLRPEQLRSLTWMVSQEAVDCCAPFVEEEISEAILEPLGWRVEGRAQRAHRVRGGVLADQVGYGKTAITLGLIDCMANDVRNEFKKLEAKGTPGKIPTKATLVIVPPHLTKQWVGECKKFAGKTFRVVEVASVSHVNALTIEKVQEADIVVVASNLFKSPNYVSNLGAFAAGGGMPENQDGRYFNARLETTLEALKKQVDLLKDKDGGAKAVLERIREVAQKGNHEENLVAQSKRLKGKSYRDQAMAVEEEEPKPKVAKAAPRKGQAEEEESKPKVTKAVPRNGKVMEVVVPSRSKTTESTPSSPSSAALDDANSSDDPKPQRRRITKKAHPVTSDEEDAVDSDIPKAKSKKPVKTAASKKKSSSAESSDYEASDAGESEDEMDVDDDSDIVIVKKPKGKAAAKPKGKGRSKASAASTDASESEGTDAMDVDEPKKGKTKPTAASKKRKTPEASSDDEGAKKPAKKRRREDADPWKLGSSVVKRHWTQMQAPPFEMFYFARKVVDEYTYLEGKTLAMISNITAERHWVLSGTPPVQDFGALKTISAFLAIHLGVDDDGEGESAKKRKREQTAVEKFHSFREVHSLEWHAHRHEIGQTFLNQFVRQNIAEIDEIPCEEHLEKIDLPAAERAIYLELEHHLRALDMTVKRSKKSESDREKRLAQALGESASAEEALLKRCSHFDLETKKENAMKACEVIVEERKKQLENCKTELVRKLKEGVKQEKAIGKLSDESLFQEYVRVTRTEGVGDEEATKIIEELLKEAQVAKSATNVPSKVDTKGRTVAKGKGKGKADDGLTEKQREAIWAHREHTHEIRRITKELTGRVRSLRYFSVVRDLQKQRDSPPEVRCDSSLCKGRVLSMDEVAVLSSCGHTGCLKCVTEHAEREECIYAHADEDNSGDEMSEDDGASKRKRAPSSKTACKAAARVLNVVRGSTLGVDDAVRDRNAKHYGMKLEKVIHLIKKRIPEEERVLIFVQFPDLMKKVGEALDSAKIKYLEIKGSATQRSKALDKYQNDTDERVLLLNVMDESASGANLTGANHAIFLSPLLAPTQEIYNACETQAIGRVRRYGQTKHVHIWRFLSTNTIDTQIFEERTGVQV